MKDLRPAIIQMHENGYSKRQMAEILIYFRKILKPRKREIKKCPVFCETSCIMVASTHAFVEMLSVLYFIKPYRIFIILKVNKFVQNVKIRIFTNP